MSTSIATAICATDSGDVASPAVFQVMTRMLSAVFSGSVSVPSPRETTTNPFAAVATMAIAASARANRADRADEREEQQECRGGRESSEHERAEGDDLSDREDVLDPEERRPGQDGRHDRGQHCDEDPEQSQHARDSMTAPWEEPARTAGLTRATLEGWQGIGASRGRAICICTPCTPTAPNRPRRSWRRRTDEGCGRCRSPTTTRRRDGRRRPRPRDPST